MRENVGWACLYIEEFETIVLSRWKKLHAQHLIERNKARSKVQFQAWILFSLTRNSGFEFFRIEASSLADG